MRHVEIPLEHSRVSGQVRKPYALWVPQLFAQLFVQSFCGTSLEALLHVCHRGYAYGCFGSNWSLLLVRRKFRLDCWWPRHMFLSADKWQ